MKFEFILSASWDTGAQDLSALEELEPYAAGKYTVTIRNDSYWGHVTLRQGRARATIAAAEKKTLDEVYDTIWALLPESTAVTFDG